MANRWRELAEANGAIAGSGSWKRRIAIALGKTAGSGSWSRRIAGGVLTAPSWRRSARKVLSDV